MICPLPATHRLHRLDPDSSTASTAGLALSSKFHARARPSRPRSGRNALLKVARLCPHTSVEERFQWRPSPSRYLSLMRPPSIRKGLSRSQRGVIWPVSRSKSACPATKSPALRELDLAVAVHDHIEGLEEAERGEISGDPRRDQILNQGVDGEALAARQFRGAHLELPVALGRGDVGLPDENASWIMMFEIDGEVRHLP